MRTNCLDCLDRTNVTQTKIVMKIVEIILDHIKFMNRKGMNGKNDQKFSMLGFNEASDGQIFEVLK